MESVAKTNFSFGLLESVIVLFGGMGRGWGGGGRGPAEKDVVKVAGDSHQDLVHFLWKTSGPELILKGSRLKQKRLYRVTNAESSCERSFSCIEPTIAVQLAEGCGS